MNIPKPIVRILEAVPWLAVLIFGAFIGWQARSALIEDERALHLSEVDALRQVQELYQERLDIKALGAGPLATLSNEELKSRIEQLKKRFGDFCSTEPLLTDYDSFRVSKDFMEKREGPLTSIHKPCDNGIKFFYKLQDRDGEYKNIPTEKLYPIAEAHIRELLVIYEAEYLPEILVLRDELITRVPEPALQYLGYQIDCRKPWQDMIGAIVYVEDLAKWIND